MPWDIQERDGRYCVVKQDGGPTVACHDTEDEAKAQLRALYAGEKRSATKTADEDGEPAGAAEVMIIDGWAAKAIDDGGRFGGYLARWGSPNLPDSTSERDYFTPETDLGRFASGEIDVLYHHSLPSVKGRPNDLAEDVIGTAKLTPDSEGLWLSGKLDLSVNGVSSVWDAMKSDDDSFGLSSGAVSHTVRRVRQPNGTNFLKRWWIVEASITPEPGERRTAAVALKSLIEGGESPSRDAPESSGPHADAAPASTWLDDALKTASDLSTTAERFAKVSPAKLAAIKTLRDSLDAVWSRHRGVDRAELQAHRERVERLLAERYPD